MKNLILKKSNFLICGFIILVIVIICISVGVSESVEKITDYFAVNLNISYSFASLPLINAVSSNNKVQLKLDPNFVTGLSMQKVVLWFYYIKMRDVKVGIVFKLFSKLVYMTRIELYYSV